MRRLWICCVLTGLAAAATAAEESREALLRVTKGQVPTDTATDGLTTLTIEDCPQLGGRALKVAYHAGDSFGDRVARVANWKPFVALEFAAYNPAQEKASLTLTVKHRRTTGYQTRVDAPFVLKPGKNAVRIGIDALRNVNGSEPDLTAVRRWYIACERDATPTVYFGDLWLVGRQPSEAPAAAARLPARRYRVTGKIGDMDVDLVVEPMDGAAPKAAAGKLRSDPARLARIRAAKMPEIDEPVLFHTPEADAILAALEVFPPDNPWNLVVEDWPLHPNSERMIASIGPDKPFRCNFDMGFILVPPDQKRVDVQIVGYPDESDPGPYPVPESVPIEGWPVHYQRDAKGPKLTLEDVQRDKLGRGGDRHAIVVDPLNRRLYEFFMMKRTDAGWQAAQASVFDLKTNKLRPKGWTSADAAGLPIFPAVVRYDEIQRGIVEHAMRVTIRKTRRAFVAPATHYASRHTNPDYPRMGERIRLRRDFDVSGFSPPVQAILKGLKKYGMLVADNGIEWAISVAPDPRIPDIHAELRKVRGRDFEVVVPPQ
ncbi:MAG: hypothetical protein ACODAJ_15635 [Planctomycetota bacterium]